MKISKNKTMIAFILGGILVLLLAFTIGVFLAFNNPAIKSQGITTTQNQKNTTVTNEKTTQETTLPVTEPLQTEIPALKPAVIGDYITVHIDEESWYLTLVNANRRIPETYTPDLIAVCGSSQKLDRRIALQYELMFADAYKAGVVLTPFSGYRSYDLQNKNFNKKVEMYEKQGLSTEEAKSQAATVILPPGCSEHNLGFAMDILCAEEWFEETNEFRWLNENAANYGFVLRYPKDKQHITNVIYEPWHWRYVGVEAAKEMKEKNLVLEEYLGVAY